jgi:shikimate dehydrogenase
VSLRRAAVLGSPIAHSLSPVLHRAAYAALGLDGWTYTAIECDEAGLPALIGQVRDDPSWAGLSLTMPLKEAVLGLLTRDGDERQELAVRIGSANTVVRRDDGSLALASTDVAGVGAALDRLPAADRVAVLGAGGTARAVVAALAARLPDSDVAVVARSAERAAPVAALHPRGTTAAWAGWSPVGIGLIVSTLPAGVTDTLAVAGWPAGTALLDVLYHPWPTPLASAAAAAGAPVVGGLVMLVAQAAEQVRLMTGRPAPLAAMTAAGESALAGSAP